MKKQSAVLTLACIVAALLAPGATARAAETVHLYLPGIKGEATQKSLGRQDSIECVQYEQVVSALKQEGEKGAPFVFRVVKRIDKASPKLMQLVNSRQAMPTGTFKFFRPNPTGDGTTQQFYTVEMRDVRILSIRQFVPNCIDPASSNWPPQEELVIGAGSVNWIYAGGDSA